MRRALGLWVLHRRCRILDVVLRVSFAADSRGGFGGSFNARSFFLVNKIPRNLRVTGQFDQFPESQGFLLSQVLELALTRCHHVCLVNHLQHL